MGKGPPQGHGPCKASHASVPMCIHEAINGSDGIKSQSWGREGRKGGKSEEEPRERRKGRTWSRERNFSGIRE